MKHTRRDLFKHGAMATEGATSMARAAQNNSIQLMRSVPKMAETDVLVVGGGPAGFGAAVGAARAGVRTMLIEAHGFFGGFASWRVGMPIDQVRPDGKARSTIHEMLVERLVHDGDQAINIGEHQLYCNADYLKVAMLDVLAAEGCRYLVHLRAIDAAVDRGRITGLVVSTKNGLAAITAHVVVDCTGDADIAFFSGAEMMKQTGNCRPRRYAST